MGKKKTQLPLHLEQQIEAAGSPCPTCLQRIGGEISVKCVVVLVISLCVFLSAVFWVFPQKSVGMLSRYDADQDIKLKATLQAAFRLQKPVSVLVQDIDRLAYDILNELEVPATKVYILSMHQPGPTNWTKVVFGVLPDPIDSAINPVCVGLLRSSFIDLFLKESNLTLTSTIFGQPSLFEIVKFPGGITVLPERISFISLKTQNYFNFVLNNSVKDIKEHIVLLKEEIRAWLHLRPYENVFVEVTNKNGSTTEDLIEVKTGVISDSGDIVPHRLNQLARKISDAPPSSNLGLNKTVFGKVKEVRLSSYLNSTLHPTPSISPAPAPAPSLSPSYPSAPTPTPSVPSPHHGSTISPSPSPSLQIGPSAPSQPPSVARSPSPLASPLTSSGGGVSFNRIWIWLYRFLTFCLLLWG